jgi:hypothetical protein
VLLALIALPFLQRARLPAASVCSSVPAGTDSDIVEALRRGSSDSLNQTGPQVVKPTLTVRPGSPVRAIVDHASYSPFHRRPGNNHRLTRSIREYGIDQQVETTMFAKTRIALSVAIVLGAASAAHAGGLPRIDIEKMCRASEGALFGDNSANLDICLGDEQAAHEQLVKGWATFLATDKVHCVQPAEYLPSYVEWLTCLEMEMDFRKIRK